MDLSIIIVNYNTADFLESCLRSIYEQEGDEIEYEIIVVDNASIDDSIAIVKNTFAKVQIIESRENLYFNKANNLGIIRSKGRNIFILNPDTELQKGTLKSMVSILDNTEYLAAITCKSVFPDGTVQRNCSKFPKYIDLVFSYTIVGDLFESLRNKLKQSYFYGSWDRLSDRIVEVIPGSAMMIKREVIDSIGLFDESLLLYFSDDDLCERARRKGYNLMYLSICTIVHHESQSVKKEKKTKIYKIYVEDLKTFSYKYYGTVLTVVLKFLLAMSLAFRKIFEKL